MDMKDPSEESTIKRLYELFKEKKGVESILEIINNKDEE